MYGYKIDHHETVCDYMHGLIDGFSLCDLQNWSMNLSQPSLSVVHDKSLWLYDKLNG